MRSIRSRWRRMSAPRSAKVSSISASNHGASPCHGTSHCRRRVRPVERRGDGDREFSDVRNVDERGVIALEIDRGETPSPEPLEPSPRGRPRSWIGTVRSAFHGVSGTGVRCSSGDSNWARRSCSLRSRAATRLLESRSLPRDPDIIDLRYFSQVSSASTLACRLRQGHRPDRSHPESRPVCPTFGPISR